MTGLAIRPDGTPAQVVREFMLDDWHRAADDAIRDAAEAVSHSLCLTIGLATRRPPEKLIPLVSALTTTIAGFPVTPGEREFVAVPDVPDAFHALSEVTVRRPRASVVLGQLLRQTELLPVVAGLAAEAAAYSMLLGGPEFGTWLGRRPPVRPDPAPERPHIRYDRDRGTLRLVLDRPERRNAFSFRMREALFDALELARLDGTVTRVELAGAGSAFSSGGDLAEFGTATDLVAAYLVRLDRAPWRLIDRMRDQVTVHVHGAAVGAGVELAAFAGRVVASPAAYFLLPEVRMGLVPGAGGTVSVPRRIGRWRAAWMMLSGARVDAATALGWGLVDDVDP